MEENTRKKLNFTLGIFDEISEKIEIKIKEESEKCDIYGVGIYTDKFVIENFMTYPSKTLEERIQNVKKLSGVAFTFPVNTSNSTKVKEIIENAYKEYLQNNNK